MLFTVYVEHATGSNDDADNVWIEAGRNNWEVFIYGDDWSGPDSRDDVVFDSDSEKMKWVVGSLRKCGWGVISSLFLRSDVCAFLEKLRYYMESTSRAHTFHW